LILIVYCKLAKCGNIMKYFRHTSLHTLSIKKIAYIIVIKVRFNEVNIQNQAKQSDTGDKLHENGNCVNFGVCVGIFSSILYYFITFLGCLVLGLFLFY